MPVRKVDIHTFLTLAKEFPIMDVRSPSEYAYAHIPGAFSLPVFLDEERSEIGTTYKQVNREEAIKIGLKYFGPRLNQHVQQVEQILKEWPIREEPKILMHCWRGGMRSGAMAWLMSFCGFDVVLLEGGYKSFRNHVLQQLELPFQFRVLGGYTGSGKTEVLNALKKTGEPVIDLEGLASHKGSAFGALGMKPQPSQEQFENCLWNELTPFFSSPPDKPFHQEKPIWIENESQRIGLVNLPQAFHLNMLFAPVYALMIDFEERLNFIIRNYGGFEREKLVNAILRMQKRLGGLDTKNAIQFLVEGNVKECFRVLLTYYDKQYKRSEEMSERKYFKISAAEVNPAANARLVLTYLTQSNS